MALIFRTSLIPAACEMSGCTMSTTPRCISKSQREYRRSPSAIGVALQPRLPSGTLSASPEPLNSGTLSPGILYVVAPRNPELGTRNPELGTRNPETSHRSTGFRFLQKSLKLRPCWQSSEIAVACDRHETGSTTPAHGFCKSYFVKQSRKNTGTERVAGGDRVDFPEGGGAESIHQTGPADRRRLASFPSALMKLPHQGRERATHPPFLRLFLGPRTKVSASRGGYLAGPGLKGTRSLGTPSARWPPARSFNLRLGLNTTSVTVSLNLRITATIVSRLFSLSPEVMPANIRLRADSPRN